ncbi:MAG: 1-deoxy-D-xylulose-5-phosphate reductoisomerase [bacterium]|nr:1-deoxy-D-xylulose-5-phosphate reductoisomerase [bacterium]
MTKNITILGSTGSIGESTLRVVRSLNSEYRVYGLACGRNIALLEEQVKEFRPHVVSIEAPDILSSQEYRDFKSRCRDVEFLEGAEGTEELGRRPVDVLLSAIVGAAGLRPTLAALPFTKRIALANKETLVMAGELFMSRAAEENVELIPVDSEHSAIFSLLEKESNEDVERIILTASGGSLRDLDASKMDSVTPEMALAHPTWDMGSKITIDSATLMNKGLEVIEAHYLFNVEYNKIDVIIHPESVIHSMIETVDGAVYAHMGVADMALPILNALKYPKKVKNDFGRLNLAEQGSLNFISYDSKKYPALELCYQAGKTGGTMPAVLNGANEAAVAAFLGKKILFTDIVKIVEKTMEQHNTIKNPGIEDIFDADTESRETAQKMINMMKR